MGLIEAPPRLLPDEELSSILVRAFGSGRRSDYDMLSAVTFQVMGWRLGEAIGGDDEPMVTLVNKVLIRLEDAGSAKCEEAAAAFMRALPGSRELRAWAGRKRPALLDLVSEADFLAAERELQRQRVASVSEVFDELQRSRDVNRIVGQRARDDLVLVAANLSRLSACKGVHDLLHGAQTVPYAELSSLMAPSAVLTAEDDPRLESQLIALQTAQVRIETYLQMLDGDSDWLRDLQDAIDLIGTEPRDVASIRLGLFGLRAVLRQQLPIFDRAIIEAARDIPFGRVVEFLGDTARLAAVPQTLVQPLKVAANDLAALDRILDRTLRLHERWQAIDARLWPIEQELQTPEGGIELIRLHWRTIERSLDTLRLSAPDMWDPNLDRARAQVGQALLSGGVDLMAGALLTFVRIGRLQFLRVDKAVLEHCNRIGALQRPIQQLLREG
ncbi:hypothetical protein [Caulobacter rhizosphaerae]|uniref:hypothetical protein n=1 Tax=Caulobacter rhizosphaerae TaxID=2010972 RepID=UPI0013D2AA4B|nr:hypothetical protein [Caulobacter rhizosphaerae]GGL35590.1 hypothetical protein GCM10010983_35730 [Caulobacter rhizosphaerae]